MREEGREGEREERRREERMENGMGIYVEVKPREILPRSLPRRFIYSSYKHQQTPPFSID